MNLERLRYFKLLAERGHLRETAELVNLSPGALSRSMKTLEAELGVALFRRVGKHLILSDRGRGMVAMADRLLGEYASFRQAVVAGVPGPAPVRFCSHSVFTTYFLGHALRLHMATEEVFAKNLGPGAIEASIAGMESDFGLTYFPVPTEGIEFVPVTRIAMGAFVRRGSFREIPFDRIPCSVPILRVAEGAPRPGTVDAWPDAVRRNATRYHFDQLETALESCRQGLSWGYFPLFVSFLHNKQVKKEFEIERLFEPKSARPRGVSPKAFLVKRAGEEESPAMKKTCAALRLVGQEAVSHFSRVRILRDSRPT